LRRAVVAAAALVLGAGMLVQATPDAHAGTWPERPVRLVVPFAAGTQIDNAARLVGARLGDALGQSVVVENRPGASGNIGAEMVARSAADGYTLLVTGSVITLLPTTLGPQAVDPVTALVPVAKLARVPLVIVAHPSLKVGSLAELIALARREPGRIAYASSGVGTAAHLSAATLAQRAGVAMVHVPYVNTGQALNDVLAGEPSVYFAFRGPIDAHVRNGRLKVLAVMSNERMQSWPDVPTASELGYRESAVDPWNGVLAPAGTPPEVVDRLARELASILRQDDVRTRLAAMGLEPALLSPERFGIEIREATNRWPTVVKTIDLRSQ
jgi:tripartite-type tricarboxylate transporter receptor subunit TctC